MMFSRFGYLQICAFVLAVLALSAIPSSAQLPEFIQQIADPLNLTNVFGGPQITGNGIRFQPPHLDQVPYFIQGLPAQVAQSFLNPVGSALASRIRQERQTVRSQGCGPAPGSVVSALSHFMPPSVFNGVCWATLRPGVNIATLVIQDGGMAAVTFDDTIVFKDEDTASQPDIWAHELIHVGQYRRLSVEGFANIYSYDFRRLEGEAYEFQDFVLARINPQGGGQQTYYNPSDNWNPPQQMTAANWAAQARRVIDPQSCISVGGTMWAGGTAVQVVNNCPVDLVVTDFVDQNMQTGQLFQRPCLQNCVVKSTLTTPGYWTFPVPPGFANQTVNMRWY
jgi:hypothetical protein